MKSKILLQFAHPAMHRSRANRLLYAAAREVAGVTVRNLYEVYPDFLIDVGAEQRLMEAHEILVLQHPFYWYSAPSIVKEWMDLVFQPGWAYGKGGEALRGKTWIQAVTTGGGVEVYCREGRHGHTVRDFLLPFEQSARLCGMRFAPPFVVYGAGEKTEAELRASAAEYARVLEGLRDGRIDLAAADRCGCLSDGNEGTLANGGMGREKAGASGR